MTCKKPPEKTVEAIVQVMNSIRFYDTIYIELPVLGKAGYKNGFFQSDEDKERESKDNPSGNSFSRGTTRGRDSNLS